MSDSIWTGVFKCLQSFLYAIPFFLNQPASDHKSRPIESIMTMHTNLWIDHSSCPGGFQTFFDNSNKSGHVFFCRWNFCSCRMLVVGYRSVLEGGWIVCCIHSRRNIDYVPNIGVLTDEMKGRVSSISLSECLNEV